MKAIKYKLTGLEAISRKLLEEVRDKFYDDNDSFDRIEFYIFQALHAQYAWELEKGKVMKIVEAMHSMDIESVPAKRRFNSAFRKLVRGGFLYSKKGTPANGYFGDTEKNRFYGVQLDRDLIAKRRAA